MKKEKSIQADIWFIKGILQNEYQENDNSPLTPRGLQEKQSLERIISALEAMRDAGDILPEKKTYQNTGEWCDGGAYLAKGFNSCLDLCQVVTAKLLLEIKELKDAKKE